jgi:hypothetical protein
MDSFWGELEAAGDLAPLHTEFVPSSPRCLTGCGRVAVFRTYSGQYCCVMCKSGSRHRYPCATANCNRQANRLVGQHQYCMSCVAMENVQQLHCVGGCSNIPTFRTTRGLLYCRACRPGKRVSRSGRCIVCDVKATHRQRGEGFCRLHRPIGAPPIDRPCAGECGHTGAYIDPEGQRWCRSCRPHTARSRCACGSPVYAVDREGVIRCRGCIL